MPWATPNGLLWNGILMSAAFAGLEGCVLACIVISAGLPNGYIEPALANPHTAERVDFTPRGLLANGGVPFGGAVVTTVCTQQ